MRISSVNSIEPIVRNRRLLCEGDCLNRGFSRMKRIFADFKILVLQSLVEFVGFSREL